MPEHQQTQQSKESKSAFQKQAASIIQSLVSNSASIIQLARNNPKSLTPADVLQLQRTIGNRAVDRLLSSMRTPSMTQQVPIQRQEIPEEEEPLQGVFERKNEDETCSSCMQRQEIPEDEEPLQGKMIETVQREKIPEEEEKLQMKPVVQKQEISDEDETLQGKMIGTVQRQEIPEEEEPLQTKRENNTGMPDSLKAGLESLSGIDMSDLRVHYNSSKPTEVGALAYAQGTNIHVAPGQERHLPHETWHVVQQAQGRVRPTMQLKRVAVNDDRLLEREADVMGERASQVSCDSLQRNVNEQDVLEIAGNRAETVSQRKLKDRITTLSRNLSKPSTIQCAWTTEEVNKILKKDHKGKDAVTSLNDQAYSVIHFDKYEFERQFYTDATKTVKDGPPKKYERNGWHIRAKKEIALSDKTDNKGAASTLVHEVTHANQHKENEAANLAGIPNPFPDTLSKELDAHIKHEEFNIAAEIAPIDPSFRNKTTGKIDKDAIKTYVERVYAVGAGKRYYTDTEPTYNVIEKIKPWPAIK
jgi:hypothetical protein